MAWWLTMRRELPRPVSRDRSFRYEPQSMGPLIGSDYQPSCTKCQAPVSGGCHWRCHRVSYPWRSWSLVCLSYVLSNVSNMLKKIEKGSQWKFPERPLLRRDWKHGANFCSWSSVQSRQLSDNRDSSRTWQLLSEADGLDSAASILRAFEKVPCALPFRLPENSVKGSRRERYHMVSRTSSEFGQESDRFVWK